MKRILPLIAATTLAAVSPGLQALSLAEMQVQSRLDEPLRARIPLVDLQGIDPSRLRAHLADKADFQEAGLPRAALIDDLQLSMSLEGGDPVLLLSTEQAVKEPYLELLLTLEWPGGEQRRQVNLLLDPPAYTLGPSLLTAAQTSKPKVQDAWPKAAADQRVVLPVQPEAMVDATEKAADVDGAQRQLVVEAGNTLWSLADGIRRQFDASVEQTMLALFRENPGAFEADNINTLQAGAVLDVPSRAAMTALSSAQARQQVLEQNQIWRSAQPIVVETAATDEQSSAAPAGMIMVDAEAAQAVYRAIEEANAGRVSAATDELKSVPETNVSLEHAPPATAGAEQDGDIIADMTDASVIQAGLVSVGDLEAATTRQNERLDALESNLKTTNETLAQVREQSDQLGGMMASLRQSVEGLHDQLMASLRPDPLESTGSGIGLSSLLQQMKGNMITIGGIAAIALLLPFAVLRRRQRTRDDKQNDSDRDQPPSQTIEKGDDAAMTWPEMQFETQFEADVPTVSMSVDEDEFQDQRAQTHTLNDADVFIAYGRHAAARELLEQELKNAPERHDLRLRLLSVYIALDEREAAEREADFLQNHAQPAYHQEVQRLMAGFDAQHDEAVFDQAVQEKALSEAAQSPLMDESDTSETTFETLAVEAGNEKERTCSVDEHVIDYQPPSLQATNSSRHVGEPSEIVYPGRLDMAGPDGKNATASGQEDDNGESWDIQEITFEPGRRNEQHSAPDTFRH
ncbi:type IV pilus assembly protein FimV [Halomonas sp. GXIMD04776]|uniref:type IV pilus assembly protein FimV n=1 Tax=Halomonas sp. GXIMD04776 TaxID=3415605 RepID=UPI003C978554